MNIRTNCCYSVDTQPCKLYKSHKLNKFGTYQDSNNNNFLNKHRLLFCKSCNSCMMNKSNNRDQNKELIRIDSLMRLVNTLNSSLYRMNKESNKTDSCQDSNNDILRLLQKNLWNRLHSNFLMNKISSLKLSMWIIVFCC